MTCVFPPETYSTTGFLAPVIWRPISISGRCMVRKTVMKSGNTQLTANAVINTDKRLVEQERQCPCDQSNRCQRRTHTGSYSAMASSECRSDRFPSSLPWVKQIQSTSWIDSPAFFKESLITVIAQFRWCVAVSRGRKPSPGGVIYVCRTFDRTVVDPSGECLMMPAPSLLAEPSSPKAIYALSMLSISLEVYRMCISHQEP